MSEYRVACFDPPCRYLFDSGLSGTFDIQMQYLEEEINSTFIIGFNELKTMAVDADVSDEDMPVPASTSSPINVTESVIDVAKDPVVSAKDEAIIWSDMALEAVNRLSNDIERIKWKANRVSFDILHDYGDQYGFYRLVVSMQYICRLLVSKPVSNFI